MKQCPGCDRHLLVAEVQCPFCGASFATTCATTFTPPGARAAPYVLSVLLLGGIGCVARSAPDDGPAGADDDAAVDSTDTGDDGAPPMTTTAPSPSDDDTGVPPSPTDTGDDMTEGPATDDWDDQGCSFYAGCSPDGGTTIYECDLFAQDCPEGEKCMPWAYDGGLEWNATRCAPVDGSPAAVGEPCTVEGSGVSGIDDCVSASMCWDVDPDTNVGTCAAMCQGSVSDPICDPGDTCIMPTGTALSLCLPECHPLLQDCGDGQGCYAFDDAFACWPSAPATVDVGEACPSFDACEPGLACLAGAAVSCASPSCCAAYCDLNAGDPDAACVAIDPTLSCVPFYGEAMAPPGYDNVGLCVLG